MTYAFILGLLLGAVAVALYCNRERIGFAVAHREQLDAAASLFDDLKRLGVSL